MKVAVIGNGAFGLGIALNLKKNGHEVKIWSDNQEKVIEYNKTGMLNKVLPGVKIPKVLMSNDLIEVVRDVEVIFIMVAARFMDEIAIQLKPLVSKKVIICNGSKGIEAHTYSFLIDVVLRNINTRNIGIISGPSFAIDLAHNEPIAFSLACNSKKACKVIKNVLQNDRVKLRATNDIIGVEICGSIKNVIALAAGMVSGLGYSESTQAFLITEALHDLKSLIDSLGGKKSTVMSYAGVGDLLLTCTSVKSRNYSFGRMIGSKASKEEIETYLKYNTVEGYYTLKSIYKLIKKKKIKLPIIDIIYKIIVNYEDPILLVDFLIKKK